MEEFFNSISQFIIFYPRGILLFLVAFLNLLWVSYIVFVKGKIKYKIYKAYLIYAFFTILWTISNAYFQSGFLTLFDERVAKFMALLANITGSFSVLGFLYISFFMKSKNKIVSNTVRFFILTWSAIVLIFNFIPGLTVQQVNIFQDGHFELIFGKWNNIFFIATIAIILTSMTNFILAIRKKSKLKIESARFYYILFGMSLMFSSLILFTLILPAFLANYNYVWLPPLFSVVEVLIVGYAILTKRFLDIRLIVSNFLKIVLSFCVAVLVSHLFYYSLIEILPFLFVHITSFFVFLIIYLRVSSILNSHNFQKRFGLTDTEFIRQISSKIKSKNKVHKSIKELENDLKSLFRESGDFDCSIILLDEKQKLKYPKLIKYLNSHKEILITEEIKVTEGDEDAIFPFIEELESLGGLCIPLFHSKNLIALFTLNKKSYGHLYTKSEIVALEQLGSYISILITEILYSSELKKEVKSKTLELRQKIKEKNELVRQQSDFMAVTAHEFRTPLSIAIFQLEEILNKSHEHPEIKQDLSVVESSLGNLKKLTQKLFAIQQYDLKKAKINKEQISIKKFIKDLYKDFLPIAKDKNLYFKLQDSLQKDINLNIDVSQIQQVLHNLLTNACKFTDKGGVILGLKKNEEDLIVFVRDTGKGIPDNMKKEIFKKFRTKHTGSGIGLGLYICQKIIELHKGKIWVEDTPKGGSTFFIRLAIDESF